MKMKLKLNILIIKKVLNIKQIYDKYLKMISLLLYNEINLKNRNILYSKV